MKKHNNQTNGFLYVLSHPSNPNLLKIGVTRRSPEIRLKEHNTQFDKEAGKIVRETGQLWEISEVIDVDDVYLAEHEFWKRPPLTELPYSFTNELLFLSEGTDLDQRWVQEGLKMAKAAGVRKNPLHPPIYKPVAKRGSKWVEANLEGSGISPVKGIGNGMTKVWFECREGHAFKISGYALIGGYKLLRKPSCPVCNPEAFNAQEMRNIELEKSAN